MKKTSIFILGVFVGLLFSGISVYAATAILSKNVGFTPTDSNWKVSNTEEALNDLYEYTNSSVFDKLSLESKKNVSSGHRMLNRSASLTLDAGNYLIFGINTTSSWRADSDTSVSEIYSNISYDSGNCTLLNDNNMVALGSKTETFLDNSSRYLGFYSYDAIWKCTFDKSTNISVSGSSSSVERFGHGIRIYSVKLD